MAIESTRKVGVSVLSSRNAQNVSSRKSSNFVEDINTANNVLVNDDPSDNFTNNYFNQNSDEQSADTPPEEQISLTPPLAEHNIEALAKSEIFSDNVSTPDISRIKIYDNNQSFIKDEETERTGRNYLKNFYKNNRQLIDIDEMI